jgi:hypothetical protein
VVVQVHLVQVVLQVHQEVLAHQEQVVALAHLVQVVLQVHQEVLAHQERAVVLVLQVHQVQGLVPFKTLD